MGNIFVCDTGLISRGVSNLREDGWHIPDNDPMDFLHYFEDGVTLCAEYKNTSSDVPTIDGWSAAMGICQDCAKKRSTRTRQESNGEIQSMDVSIN